MQPIDITSRCEIISSMYTSNLGQPGLFGYALTPFLRRLVREWPLLDSIWSSEPYEYLPLSHNPHKKTAYALLPEAAAAFSAAIFASIFRRAANIISSRLRWSAVCRSSRFALHAFALVPGAAASDAALALPPSLASLSWSLYRVIRSGSAGREGALMVCDVEDGVVEGGGGGGWNVTGG